MRRIRLVICLVVVCVMAVANFASADTIRGINIDFVSIGNAGNAADTVVMNDGTTGYGAVGYNYRIGRYNVTNAQWNAFTAAAGAPTGNDGGYGYSSYFTGVQQPTNYVSWYETLQFCNYLTSGDKSKGAYQFGGNNANPGSFLGINRTAAETTYGTVYVLPTENEWYKAAYYKPNGSGYSLYAFGTNTAPIAGVQSNYGSNVPWNVGSGAQEQNGTYDMMGNVFQWNETLISGSGYVLRGGSYSYYYGCDGDADYLASSYRGDYNPNYEGNSGVGFRVASVPEPCSLVLLLLGGLTRIRKRMSI